MEKEKLIEHFFLCSHNETHEDIKIQINDHCDPNDQEAREDFWIFRLDTSGPTYKKIITLFPGAMFSQDVGSLLEISGSLLEEGV